MLFFCLALSLFLLIIVGGFYTFVVACVRRKEQSWLVKEQIDKTAYKDYYDYILYSDKWLREHKAKDVFAMSEDGLQLHGLWVAAKNPRGTILFAHGYRSTYLVDLSLALEMYYGYGFNLLIPDQRAHGKSQGRYITFGVKESDDMKCWINYHNETFSNQPIVLVGLSMGASTMMYLADQDLPSNVSGIIADCGFSSPKEIIASVFRAVTHMPPKLCLWVTNICTKLFAGFRLDEKDSRILLRNSKLPVFLIHGEDDGFVPCEMTKEAFAVCRQPKMILLVDGADHGHSYIVDQKLYQRKVKEFLYLCGVI